MDEMDFDAYATDMRVDQSTVISASAGSGKTTAIQHVIVRAILGIGCSPINPEDMLITSFSRNAVRELKERVFDSLFKLFIYLYDISYLGKTERIESIVEIFPYVFSSEEEVSNTKINKYLKKLSKAISRTESFHITTLSSMERSLFGSIFWEKKPKILPECYSTSIQQEKTRNIFKEKIIKNLNEQEYELLESALSGGRKEGEVHFYEVDKLIFRISLHDVDVEDILKDSEEDLSILKEKLNNYFYAEKFTKYMSQDIVKTIKIMLLKELIKSGETIPTLEIRKIMKEDVKDYTGEYCNQYKFIIVDEAQDMSQSDLDSLKLLIKLMNKKPVIYIVGDSKQTLYRFRGSKPELFIDLSRNEDDTIKFERRGKLNTNFRSRKNIIDFLNTAFQRNSKEETFEYEMHKAQQETGSSKIHIERIAEKEKSWAEIVVKKIRKHLKRGEKDIAVIASKNDYLKKVAAACDNEDIKFSYPSRGPIEATKVLISILSCIEEDGCIYINETNKNFIVSNLFCASICDDSDYEILKTLVFEWGLIFSKYGFSKFIEAILRSVNFFRKDTAQTIGEVLVEHGKLKMCNDFYVVSSGLYENFDNILHSTTSETDVVRKTKEIFGKHIGEAVNDSMIKSSYVGSGVALHTIHSSKGLEFDVVIFVNRVGRKTTIVDPDKKCKIYVALTRARKHLEIITKEDDFFNNLVVSDLEDNEVDEIKEKTLEYVDEKNKFIDPESLSVQAYKYRSYSELAKANKKYSDIVMEDSNTEALTSSREIGNILHKAIEKYIPKRKHHLDVIDIALHEKKIKEEDVKSLSDMVEICVSARNVIREEEDIALIDVLEDPNFISLREEKFLIKLQEYESGGKCIIVGVIDLLIVDQHKKTLYIVDWKTGLLPKDKSDDVLSKFTMERYGIQKTLYIKSLRKIYKNVKDIVFTFCYPRYVKDGKPIIYRITDVRQ